MESWIRLIRVMTHEIMNSIAPITSLSESLLFSFRSRATEMAGNSLYLNTVDALETINATTKGLLNFVESYRQFTRIPQPQIVPSIRNSYLGGDSSSAPKMLEAVVEAKVILEGDISFCMLMRTGIAGTLNLEKNA
jgi:nitrogen fixation/metabolism regulation signal transduction histidine kinase